MVLGGNIALKASEGLAKYIFTIIKDSYKGSWYYKPLTWLGCLFFSPVLVNMKKVGLILESIMELVCLD